MASGAGVSRKRLGLTARNMFKCIGHLFFLNFFGQDFVNAKTASTYFLSASQAEKPSPLSNARETKFSSK